MKNRTELTRAAPNGAAPELRTSKDDISYLSTAMAIISINHLVIPPPRAYRDDEPTVLAPEERQALSRSCTFPHWSKTGLDQIVVE